MVATGLTTQAIHTRTIPRGVQLVYRHFGRAAGVHAARVHLD
jgi:hypothetical protein